MAQAITTHLQRTGKACRVILLNAATGATKARRTTRDSVAAAALTWGTRMVQAAAAIAPLGPVVSLRTQGKTRKA
eukprot:12881079-Prorocentrum_lima.AAC.1